MRFSSKVVEWRPTAPFKNLQQRAQILAKIRQFFADRKVMEVETPIVSQFTVTDQHLHSLAVTTPERDYYLQTSPEYAMKRLVAAGYGSIYQISKVFRASEQGARHNPEFTMLEWYRVGFDHFKLMAEVDNLVQHILKTPAAQRISYRELFKQYLGIDIVSCSDKSLTGFIDTQNWLGTSASELDRDTCLQLIMTHAIEPYLGLDVPVFVFDFPASQAALARLTSTDPPFGERFELFIKGLEIANGFHELTDYQEQQFRFQRDQKNRQNQGQKVPEIDNRFIAALQHGLPDCAGVALGIDRLIMLAVQANHIDQVIAFPWTSC
ncbi:MAG: EF-P lysine aminoacylase GenX [Proteobacteria bacterium]|nr:EF-P lysine aminoacylase GenX [Pseudomonadota bacterium]